MATLSPLYGAAQLLADDTSRITFTPDTTGTRSKDFDDTPTDFVSMDSLSATILASLNSERTDDNYVLGIRVMNGTTVLAAATAGGDYQTLGEVTSTTDATFSSAFAYVNTSASKTDWDGAQFVLQQTYTQNGGSGDGAAIRMNQAYIEGTYSTGAGANEATMSATDSVDTSDMSGGLRKSGTLSATDAIDTASFAGANAHVCTLSATDPIDTSDMSGGLGKSGTLSATDAIDTADMAGVLNVTNSGTLSATDAIDTASFTSALAYSGTLSATDPQDSASFNVSVFVEGAMSGPLAATEPADVASASLANDPNGYLYWAVYPAEQDAPLAADLINQTVENGIFWVDASPSTTQTYDNPGIYLDPGFYKLSVTWSDGLDVTDVLTSASFTTAFVHFVLYPSDQPDPNAQAIVNQTVANGIFSSVPAPAEDGIAVSDVMSGIPAGTYKLAAAWINGTTYGDNVCVTDAIPIGINKQVNAALDSTEPADVSSMLSIRVPTTELQIDFAITEAPDSVSAFVLLSKSITVSLAATEQPDTASMIGNAEARGSINGLLRSTEPMDRAALFGTTVFTEVWTTIDRPSNNWVEID